MKNSGTGLITLCISCKLLRLLVVNILILIILDGNRVKIQGIINIVVATILFSWLLLFCHTHPSPPFVTLHVLLHTHSILGHFHLIAPQRNYLASLLRPSNNCLLYIIIKRECVINHVAIGRVGTNCRICSGINAIGIFSILSNGALFANAKRFNLSSLNRESSSSPPFAFPCNSIITSAA